jgi:hypothetical protein
VSAIPEPASPFPPPPHPPEQRNGCLTAILIVIGIVLLLPGLCSLFFVFGGLVKSAEDAWFVAALGTVGCVGIAIIWWAVRRRGPRA